jgi:hypothetical protein
MSNYHRTGKAYYETHKEDYARRDRKRRERKQQRKKELRAERAEGISPNGSLLNNKYLSFPPYLETWGLDVATESWTE